MECCNIQYAEGTAGRDGCLELSLKWDDKGVL